MKYENALFLFNGNAGNRDLEQKLSQTLPILSQSIKQITVLKTQTINELKDGCVAYASEVELIIIMGGDGTVHECINSIAELEIRPIIAILPAGTCNDFSRMLRIPQNLRQAAEAIVNGEIIPIDLGKTDNWYFLNFWGIGLVADTSLNINETQKRSLGVLSYFMSSIKTVTQSEPFSYKMKTDVETYEGEAVMLVVLNGGFIGTRQIPIPSIRSDDGFFDILIVKNSTLASFKELIMLDQPNNNLDQLSELIYFQAKELTISTDPTKTIDMDGEINGMTPSELSILPGHIQMIKGSSG
ncbi:YegS/Rv2252/BmrU family lipid kinase [Virgibacillus oceani]|uniref:Lipid kinase BmrU n=1 Tax=Virgibacillus oceani TaxID=1479511 RepID=A0A917HQT9_9BACI|nr:YegS/Rv2252/BmrU family lipid kinase [Virgibacillus oceani]GGG87706.1 putative lipid kinase BmrU [Virgibacillus oceani]